MHKQFEDRLTIHIYNHFPDKCKEMDDARVRTIIQEGILRAYQYEITSERDIAKYIHLIFAFHENFDRDPKLPWAAKILNDDTLVGPSTRMECLFQESKKYPPKDNDNSELIEIISRQVQGQYT